MLPVEIVPPCMEDSMGAVEATILLARQSSTHPLKTIVGHVDLLVPCSG